MKVKEMAESSALLKRLQFSLPLLARLHPQGDHDHRGVAILMMHSEVQTQVTADIYKSMTFSSSISSCVLTNSRTSCSHISLHDCMVVWCLALSPQQEDS